MRPPYYLAPDRISTDTIKALEQLLAEAKDGRLIGIAYTGMYKQRQYFADAAGECKRNPTFARGMVQALDDRLATWIGSRPPS